MAVAMPHPSTMERAAIEKELLALRVLVASYTDAIEAKELTLTTQGKVRLMAAASTCRMIYGQA